mmetsp:Transcript_26438/g.48400  ORF Transcript_26438/g.48400 Transcript_26438/m.48400 type:complete len:205 (+) Transcript_26438:1064-1678(+)
MLSPNSRTPSRIRFKTSSLACLGSACSGEAFSTLRKVASVASTIFSSNSAEAMAARPASSTMMARSRRPTPATVMDAQSRCSFMASSAQAATPDTASPNCRKASDAPCNSLALCFVISRRVPKARFLGRACASMLSSCAFTIRCATMPTRSAAALALAVRVMAASMDALCGRASASVFLAFVGLPNTPPVAPSLRCRSTLVYAC